MPAYFRPHWIVVAALAIAASPDGLFAQVSPSAKPDSEIDSQRGARIGAATTANTGLASFLLPQVRSRLQEHHLRAQPFDDAISKELFERFFAALDPDKSVFFAADIREFRASETLLDDHFAAGDASFPRRVFERFLTRLAARTQATTSIAAAELAFDEEELYLRDRTLADYPENEAEAKSLWRQRVKFQLLQDGATSVDTERLDRLRARARRTHKEWQAKTESDVVALFVDAAARSFDPYSGYLTPAGIKELQISLRLRLEGIGAYLGFEDGAVRVIALIPGGPAARSGRLRSGDRITAIGARVGALTATKGLSLAQVVRRIRGRSGTTVRLQITRAGEPLPAPLVITRGSIQLEAPAASGEVRAYTPESGAALAVGLLRLPSFYGTDGEDGRRSSHDVRRILATFRAEGVDVVVFDLRGNVGGLLAESTAALDLFLDTGPVLLIDEFETETETVTVETAGRAWDGPLVVLTSARTASAAEIFAAAIRDYERGLLVGAARTYGKGTVQEILPLTGADGSVDARFGALRVTKAEFRSPLGSPVHERGVTAHVVLDGDSVPGSFGGPTGSRPPDLVVPVEGRTSPRVLRRVRRRFEKRRVQAGIDRDVPFDFASASWVRLHPESFRALRAPQRLKAETRQPSPPVRAVTTDRGSDERRVEEWLRVTADYVAALRAIR